MSDKYINISKFMSLILRHKPEIINIKLDKNGWVDINEFILKINKYSNFNINFDTLKCIVDTNNKKRFKISEDCLKIRANQGHSLDVDLDLKEEVPPDVLYHGTAIRFLDSIISIGLISKSRQYVHLSSDIYTANKVGKRHGEPIILKINSSSMYKNGYKFYLSDNGVWLTDKVPSLYIIVGGKYENIR